MEPIRVKANWKTKNKKKVFPRFSGQRAILGFLPEKCHKELPLLDNIYSNIFIDLQYK